MSIFHSLKPLMKLLIQLNKIHRHLQKGAKDGNEYFK